MHRRLASTGWLIIVALPGPVASLSASTTEVTPTDLRVATVESSPVRGAFWMLGAGTKLRTLDAGIEDINPLSVSLRHVETGLGQPRGFEDVYQVPGRSDLLMRASGALYAVFPYSVYAAYRGRQVPQIPASTVFQIGDIPLERTEPRATEPGTIRSGAEWTPIHSGSRVLPIDERRLAELLDIRQAREAPALPTMLNDPEYRQTRLTELMHRAASAEIRSRAVGESR